MRRVTPRPELVRDDPLPGPLRRLNPASHIDCPKCKRATKSDILETRQGPNGSIKRRRKCRPCGINFTTYERIEENRPITYREGRELLSRAHALLTRVLTKMTDSHNIMQENDNDRVHQDRT